MVPDPRAWPFRTLPLLLIIAFAALPLVFATLSTIVAVAYAVAIVSFVAGLVVGERTDRLDEVERRQRLEVRRQLRQEVLQRGATATRSPAPGPAPSSTPTRP